jgi:hypothetical protein
MATKTSVRRKVADMRRTAASAKSVLDFNDWPVQQRVDYLRAFANIMRQEALEAYAEIHDYAEQLALAENERLAEESIEQHEKAVAAREDLP